MNANQGNDPSKANLKQMFPLVCETMNNNTILLAGKVDEAVSGVNKLSNDLKAITPKINDLVTSKQSLTVEDNLIGFAKHIGQFQYNDQVIETAQEEVINESNIQNIPLAQPVTSDFKYELWGSHTSMKSLFNEWFAV